MVRSGQGFVASYERGYRVRIDSLVEAIRDGDEAADPFRVSVISALIGMRKRVPSFLVPGGDLEEYDLKDRALFNALKAFHKDGFVDVPLYGPQSFELDGLGSVVMRHSFLRAAKSNTGRTHRGEEDLSLEVARKPGDFIFTSQIIEGQEIMRYNVGGNQLVLALNKYRSPVGSVGDRSSLHGLLFFEDQIGGNHVQYIDPHADADLIRTLFKLVGQNSFDPRVFIGINSAGGDSSVNDLHSQILINQGKKDSLPIVEKLDELAAKNQSIFFDCYVSPTLYFPALEGSVDQLLEAIAVCNQLNNEGHNVQYNLLFNQRGVFLFPRKHRLSPEYLIRKSRYPGLCVSHGFTSMAGAMVSANPDLFEDRGDLGKYAQGLQAMYGALKVDQEARERLKNHMS